MFVFFITNGYEIYTNKFVIIKLILLFVFAISICKTNSIVLSQTKQNKKRELIVQKQKTSMPFIIFTNHRLYEVFREQ